MKLPAVNRVRRSISSPVFFAVLWAAYACGSIPCDALDGNCNPAANLALYGRCETASTWRTVDDYQLTAGKSAQYTSLVAHGDVVYVAGYARDAADKLHWITRRADGGGTWTTVDDYQLNAGQDSAAMGMAVDALGRPWVVGCGGGDFSTQTCRWITRRGDANGANWITLDNFEPGSGKSLAVSIQINQAGQPVVSGGSGTIFAWLSRVGLDDGLTWTVTEQYQSNPGDFAVAQRNLAHSSGALFAAGTSINSVDSIGYWETRSSADGGLTWARADLFFDDASSPDAAAGIFEDLNGDIYVVGTVERTGGAWFTRKSSDLGLSWSTADDYSFEPTQFSVAVAGGTDLFNRPYVVGRGRDASSKEHWLVRRGIAGGSAWSNMEDFQYVAGQSASAGAFARDASGNLFVAGFGEDGTASHALVRKLDCL